MSWVINHDAGAGRRASGDPCRKRCRVQAKTGSGKTAAFGLGLLHKLMRRYFKPRL